MKLRGAALGSQFRSRSSPLASRCAPNRISLWGAAPVHRRIDCPDNAVDLDLADAMESERGRKRARDYGTTRLKPPSGSPPVELNGMNGGLSTCTYDVPPCAVGGTLKLN